MYDSGLTSADDARFDRSFTSVYTADSLQVRLCVAVGGCVGVCGGAAASREPPLERAGRQITTGHAVQAQARQCNAVRQSCAALPLIHQATRFPGTQVPWHVVLGNHDYCDSAEGCGTATGCPFSPLHQVRPQGCAGGVAVRGGVPAALPGRPPTLSASTLCLSHPPTHARPQLNISLARNKDARWHCERSYTHRLVDGRWVGSGLGRWPAAACAHPLGWACTLLCHPARTAAPMGSSEIKPPLPL